MQALADVAARLYREGEDREADATLDTLLKKAREAGLISRSFWRSSLTTSSPSRMRGCSSPSSRRMSSSFPDRSPLATSWRPFIPPGGRRSSRSSITEKPWNWTPATGMPRRGSRNCRDETGVFPRTDLGPGVCPAGGAGRVEDAGTEPGIPRRHLVSLSLRLGREDEKPPAHLRLLEPAARPSSRSLDSGSIEPAEIADQDVTVFVSHSHSDHDDPLILEWRCAVKNIRYVWGWEGPDSPEDVHFGTERQTVTVDGIEIQNIHHEFDRDPESAFLVRTDGLTILFAGDHGHSRGLENPVFKDNVLYLAGQAPLWTFFPSHYSAGRSRRSGPSSPARPSPCTTAVANGSMTRFRKESGPWAWMSPSAPRENVASDSSTHRGPSLKTASRLRKALDFSASCAKIYGHGDQTRPPHPIFRLPQAQPGHFRPQGQG